MTIARVQSAQGHGTGTTASASFGSASTGGNLLIAIVVPNGNAVTASNPTGMSSLVVNTSTDANNMYLFVETAATSTTTISSTLSGSTGWIMFIGEYSGVSAVANANHASNPSGGTPTVSSGTIVASTSNNLFVAGMNNSAGDPLSGPSNGFSLVQAHTDNVANGAIYADLIATSPGTYSTSCGSGSGGNGIIGSFSPTGASGTQGNTIWFGSVF